MTNEPTVYSTDNPAAVAAFETAQQTMHDFARTIVEDARCLGKNKGPLQSTSLLGGAACVGLAPDAPTDPPEGWAYVKGRNRLEPRRGKAGEAARRWLADHQPPEGADVRTVLEREGLPRNDRRGSDNDGRYRIGVPEILLHDGTLWALYQGTPGHWFGGGDECTWTPRRLSEFYAAREAMQATANTSTS